MGDELERRRGTRNSETAVGVLIPRRIPPHCGEQSTKPVIDRRKVSAWFDGIAPSVWRDFQIRKGVGGCPFVGVLLN